MTRRENTFTALSKVIPPNEENKATRVELFDIGKAELIGKHERC